MFATGVGMIWSRRGDTFERRPKVWLVVLLGATNGVIASLVGDENRFLIVLAPHCGRFGYELCRGHECLHHCAAVSTGLLGHLGQTEILWVFTLVFTGLSIVGSMNGASRIGKVPEKKLKKDFGIVVLAMAVYALGCGR